MKRIYRTVEYNHQLNQSDNRTSFSSRIAYFKLKNQPILFLGNLVFLFF